jgi:hypothetical protein
MPAKTAEDLKSEAADQFNVVSSNGRPVAAVAPMSYVQSNYNEALRYAREVIDHRDLTIESSVDDSRVLFTSEPSLALEVDAVQTSQQ